MMDEKEKLLKLNQKEKVVSEFIVGLQVILSFIFIVSALMDFFSLIDMRFDILIYSMIVSVFSGILILLFFGYAHFDQINMYNNRIIDKYQDMLPYLTQEEMITFMKDNFILKSGNRISQELISLQSAYIISYKQYMIRIVDNNALEYEVTEKKIYDLKQLKDLIAWYHSYGDNEKFKIYNKLETSQKLAYIEKNSLIYQELCEKSMSDFLSDNQYQFIHIFEEMKSTLIKAAISFIEEEEKMMHKRFSNIKRQQETMIENDKNKKKQLLEKKVIDEVKLGEMLLK